MAPQLCWGLFFHLLPYSLSLFIPQLLFTLLSGVNGAKCNLNVNMTRTVAKSPIYHALLV